MLAMDAQLGDRERIVWTCRYATEEIEELWRSLPVATATAPATVWTNFQKQVKEGKGG